MTQLLFGSVDVCDGSEFIDMDMDEGLNCGKQPSDATRHLQLQLEEVCTQPNEIARQEL